MIYIEFAIIVLVILTLNRVTAMLNIRYRLVALNKDLFLGLAKRYSKLRYFMKDSDDLEAIDSANFRSVQDFVNDVSIPVIEQINSLKGDVIPSQIQFAIDEVIQAESEYNLVLNSYRLLYLNYNDKVVSIVNRPFFYIIKLFFEGIKIIDITSEEGRSQ
jgi:hypothetical protein